MSKTPKKTRLLVFVNSFQREIYYISSYFSTRIGKTESDKIIHSLANDIAAIPFFFEKNRDDEYEWLLGFICYNIVLDCLDPKLNSSNNHLNLINKWNLLDNETKNSYFLLTSNNKSFLSVINSIQDLIKLESQVDFSHTWLNSSIDKIESIILNFTEIMISFNENTSESEFETLNELKKLISLSKRPYKQINYKEYLINKYDEIGFEDKKNKLVISDPNEIRSLILKNQKKISSIDKVHIHEFLKLQKYLVNQKDLIHQSIEILKVQNVKSSIDTWIELIKNQIGTYNVIYLNSVTMIVCLCENELVVFYELYEKFDNLGVFKTSYEKEVLESLSSIGTNINDLNNNIVHKLMIIELELKNISEGLSELNSTMEKNLQAINNLERSIVSGFSSLETSIGESFNQLSQNISGHLSKIESGISYNNLISTVNSYQSHKINKNTKSLRKLN